MVGEVLVAHEGELQGGEAGAQGLADQVAAKAVHHGETAQAALGQQAYGAGQDGLAPHLQQALGAVVGQGAQPGRLTGRQQHASNGRLLPPRSATRRRSTASRQPRMARPTVVPTDEAEPEVGGQVVGGAGQHHQRQVHGRTQHHRRLHHRTPLLLPVLQLHARPRRRLVVPVPRVPEAHVQGVDADQQPVPAVAARGEVRRRAPQLGQLHLGVAAPVVDPLQPLVAEPVHHGAPPRVADAAGHAHQPDEGRARPLHVQAVEHAHQHGRVGGVVHQAVEQVAGQAAAAPRPGQHAVGAVHGVGQEEQDRAPDQQRRRALPVAGARRQTQQQADEGDLVGSDARGLQQLHHDEGQRPVDHEVEDFLDLGGLEQAAEIPAPTAAAADHATSPPAAALSPSAGQAWRTASHRAAVSSLVPRLMRA